MFYRSHVLVRYVCLISTPHETEIQMNSRSKNFAQIMYADNYLDEC